MSAFCDLNVVALAYLIFGCSCFSIWVEVGGGNAFQKVLFLVLEVDVSRFLYLLDIDDVYCCEACP
jgi:hypothetical protein